MVKETFHPKAYLSSIKNIKRGLRTRTKILIVLEEQPTDATSIAKEAGILYGVAVHHLKLLRVEDIISRKGSRPQTWVLTGLGQKRLMNSI